MEYKDKNIKTNITVISDQLFNDEIFKKYFTDEVIENQQDEVDKKWIYVVCNTNINRKNLNSLLLSLANENIKFELIIESEEAYIYENYIFEKDSDYIKKSYTDESLDPINGREHLANILFHPNVVEIKLIEL